MPVFNYKQEYERYKKYYMSLEPILNKQQNRAYTSVIFSFLAVSLFGWYAIRPTMQTIFTLKREIQDRTLIDKQMEDKISALILAQAQFQDLQNVTPVLLNALPENPDAVQALVQLRGLAEDTGTVITSMSVPSVDIVNETAAQKKPGNGKIISIPITISISGSYEQVKHFLTGVNTLRRVTQITSMSFAPQKVAAREEASGSAQLESTGTTVQLDLKLIVFYITP